MRYPVHLPNHPPIAMTRNSPKTKVCYSTPDLAMLPGHLVRRMQQIAVAILLEETKRWDLTPVQCAILITVGKESGIDQRTLAATVGFDTSTIVGVINRLESRKLLRRAISSKDRRVRNLTLTDAGRTLINAAAPSVMNAQDRMLAPLSEREQAEFMRLLRTLVTANNHFSRAPSET